MNIVLTGRECYSQLQVLPEQKKDKNELPYWRATYANKVFIVREEFKAHWDAGALAEIVLTPEQREVKDDLGNTTMIDGFKTTGSLTYLQAKAITKNEAELTAITKQIEKEYKLDPAMLA